MRRWREVLYWGLALGWFLMLGAFLVTDWEPGPLTVGSALAIVTVQIIQEAVESRLEHYKSEYVRLTGREWRA